MQHRKRTLSCGSYRLVKYTPRASAFTLLCLGPFFVPSVPGNGGHFAKNGALDCKYLEIMPELFPDTQVASLDSQARLNGESSSRPTHNAIACCLLIAWCNCNAVFDAAYSAKERARHTRAFRCTATTGRHKKDDIVEVFP